MRTLTFSGASSSAVPKRSQLHSPIQKRKLSNPDPILFDDFTVIKTTQDPLKYLDDPLPFSWLDVCNRLHALSDEEQLLPLHCEDEESEQVSVLSIMRECNALEGVEGLIAQKRRAVAMLQYFHRLGLVVYFDDVPGRTQRTLMQLICSTRDAHWIP